MELSINYVDGSGRYLKAPFFVFIRGKKNSSNLEDLINDLSMAGVKSAEAVSKTGTVLLRVLNSTPKEDISTTALTKQEVKEIKAGFPKHSRKWETILLFN